MSEKYGYRWPVDGRGKNKSVKEFNDLELVRYHVWMARVECTIDGQRHIDEEIEYLHHWLIYYDVLTKVGQFDRDSLNYLSLEIVRLHKERTGWN